MDSILTNHGYEKANVNAATITRQSKSNLALAFVSLGRERKRDITIFYAFCRVVDDIADSTELSVIEKRVRLANWRQDASRRRSGRATCSPAMCGN
jgi:phytoene synthase